MTDVKELWFGADLQWRIVWRPDCAEVTQDGETRVVSRQEAMKLVRDAYRLDQPDTFFRERSGSRSATH